MSFNTSNIQADTFTGVYSISAPVHYVEGIPISNNTGNLKLGNADNAIVECLELESGTSVTAPLGEFDTVQLTNLISKAGVGEQIYIDGFLNLQGYGIAGLDSLTLANGEIGANGQVLSVTNGSLLWKNDVAGDVSQWATFPANSTVDFNTQSITGSYADGEGINVLTGLIMNNKSIGQASMVSGTACNFETVQTGRIYPYEQVGQPILIEGSFNMQNYGIDNLQSLTLANSTSGTEDQVLSVDANGNLKWKNDSAGDVSQWSTYAAVQDVSMNDYSLMGASTVNTEILATSVIESKDGVQFPVRFSSILNIDNYGIENLRTLTVGGSIAGTEDQVLSVDANGNLKWKNDSAGDVSQWATFDAVQDVNMNDFVLNSVGGISGSGGSINLLSGIDAGNNNIGGVNVLECKRIECEYRPENTYYVSANGDDSYARGNIESPFQTIQQAITFAENYTGNNDYKYIVVLPGNYNENLTITKRIHLIGMAQSPYSASVGCVISGSININVGSNGGDMFNNAVNISGFLIGSQVSFISTQNSILNMENCYIYSDDNVSGRGLYFNPSCANSRLRLTNTIIISGGSSGLDPLIEITSVSQVLMNNCYFSAKGLQNVLKFSGTATCDTINNVKFESGNSGANIQAIVEITATVSATYTFSNCGFIYASATNKSANAQASGIYSNSSTGNNRIVALYCSFFLLGTSSSLNYAIQDAYTGGASQMIVLYYMNGASLQNAFSIRGTLNVSKFQLQIVS
jgi:hypothetical protein